ncbi:MAG: hypothetical protein ACOYK7_15620 [Pirellulales bacterium]|jgi:hypothetical protein
MNDRRLGWMLPFVATVWWMAAPTAGAQCCLNDLFAGCASCFRRAPAAYAVAPIAAPMAMAPQQYAVAPVPAPPPPVVVPVQQVSYVPETTYRTQYQCVPVTSYKPSTEIDPCTGCTRECMQQVTQYVQQAVNVPVTQYRAVYSTKYVQMQQGGAQVAAPQPVYGQPLPAMPAAAPVMPGPAGAATSPFAAPLQTTPQAWGSAGADIPNQLIPGQTSIAAPTLAQPPAVPQPTFQQQIVPQSGIYAAPQGGFSPQPTAPPALTPTPALRPIPELPNGAASTEGASAAKAPPAPGAGSTLAAPSIAPPSLSPASPAAPAPATSGSSVPAGGIGTGAAMPTLQGTGPAANTGAFPRLLEPTGHTTSWQPVTPAPPGHGMAASYPRAALPSRLAMETP